MGIEFAKIKLIIWDLDETFWHGVLSEHTQAPIPENETLIKDMTDAGVINSICSKNNRDEVKKILQSRELWDLFVFPSINWSPKGDRIEQIIKEMNLRNENVLFIDDNETNLAEAASVCRGIMVSNTDILPSIQSYYRLAPKTDLSHKRLEQYHILEEKRDFQAKSGSNLTFLQKCNIRVSIKPDCIEHLDRISELIQRANQLNFTKIRSSAAELSSLFHDPSVQCGYVEVKDRFGDYGIVGFYAIHQSMLLHFVFSCRILNMGVEQYVYHMLGRPKLQIVGEVSSSLKSPCPEWINQTQQTNSAQKKKTARGKILIKGQCDMQQMFAFMNDGPNIITEFVYVNSKGISIEQGNHSVHIVESKTLDDDTKNRLIHELPFGDKGMFRTAIYNKDIDWIMLSTISEGNLGMYREKQSGAIVAFGEYTNDLTDETIWNQLIQKQIFTANCRFNKASLQSIREKYQFIGRITPDKVRENLEFIYSHIAPSARLVLSLGVEIPYEGNQSPAYEDRHIYHKNLNAVIREWAQDKDNVFLLDTNDYVKSQSDFTNNINHYTKEIYYRMTMDFIHLVNNGEEAFLFAATDKEKRKSEFLRKMKKIPNKIIRMISMRR